MVREAAPSPAGGAALRCTCRVSDDRSAVLVEGTPGTMPREVRHCVRLCVGPVEWTYPHLLGPRANLPAPPSGKEHLCLTAFFDADTSPPLHLVLETARELHDWCLGLQLLGRVWASEWISPATLRWRALRAYLRAGWRRTRATATSRRRAS